MAHGNMRRTRYTALSVALLLSSLNGALAQTPLIDFDRMGVVGIAGAFAGFGLSDNSSTTTAFDSSTATLLSRSYDGSLTALGSTNDGGNIVAGCTLNGVFYFGGNFTSINGTPATNVAAYTPSSGSFSALDSGGPDGPVHALYCDTANSTVWVGGKFSSPGDSVAVWESKSQKWSAPAFGGLSGGAGEVLSITTNSSGTSLFFTGSFTTSFGNSSSVTVNTTNNPNIPYSPGASSFSSSLVPISLQNAEIVAAPSSDESGFEDIDNILCPSGSDGPGFTWFAQDDEVATIIVRAYSLLNARGIRLGNTFLDGRGTTGFSLTTIPDNTVQTLTYLDPETGSEQTCTALCPLLTNSSIPYQDFLFSDNITITGFQLTLSEWQGAGSGLHILQLLSSGAFVSAIASNNTESCWASGSSSVTFTGTWTEKQATTDIPATIEAVLVSEVAVGTSASEGPSFTWMPFVSAAGDYNVYLSIPGCDDFGDCDSRTSVEVTVFAESGANPWVSTISQQNTDDQWTLIYSGAIEPSSSDFAMTVSMTLADNPTGSGQGGDYELVAGNVELVLTDPTTASHPVQETNATSSGSANSFGFFEWPLASTSSVSATGTLANSSETALDHIGIDLLSALGGSASVSSSSASISAVVQDSSGAVFLGGEFTLSSGTASGASNIVAYKNDALAALSSNGLNGAVTSFALDGQTLFVGGAFDATSSSSTALKGVAMYDITNDEWSALGGGVDGAVDSILYSDGRLLVAGNFTEVFSTTSVVFEESTSGFAVWDVANGTWINGGGYLIGNMTFVGNGSSSDGSEDEVQFVAGNLEASLEFGATGFVMLQNGANGTPEVSILGVRLDGISGNATSSSTTKRRRSQVTRPSRSWIPGMDVWRLFKRDITLASLPDAPAAASPAVLAGAFWTNSSSNREVIVIGGNFSFTSSGETYQNVAIYDNSTDTISPLIGNQLNGTVRSLLVLGDRLFIGGEFSLQGTNANGFAVYNLAQQQWDLAGVQALQASSGSSVVVRSVTSSPSQSEVVIVAGTFTQAGTIACRAICSYNANSEQWSPLGNGIQGEVASVAYAGNDENVIVASGSIALADSTPANVALYTISNSSWAAVGNGNDLPGPVTAVAVNDYNTSSIFAAGRSSDNSTAFLYSWNGETWSDVGSSFEAETDVTQLIMVPLQNTHSSNSIIQSDRVLMISGALLASSFGNASSALFDGESLVPYIITATSSGAAGVVYGLIHSYTTFSFSQRHFLATGVVILISIAISAGVVFLLVLLGILWTLFSRRGDRLGKYDPAEYEDDDSSAHRPSSLLAHINAATRGTIIGDASVFGPPAEKEGEMATAGRMAASADHNLFEVDDGTYVRPDTPSDAANGTMIGEDMSRTAHARYSFEATGEGELPLSAGQELEILDDRDAAWWYARDVRSGREGVVPAAYVY